MLLGFYQVDVAHSRKPSPAGALAGTTPVAVLVRVL